MICKLCKCNEEVVFVYTVKYNLSVIIARSIIIINGLTFQNLKQAIRLRVISLCSAFPFGKTQLFNVAFRLCEFHNGIPPLAFM